MAPRTAKAKKNADVKVLENEAPKKVRGKGKNLQEPEEEVPELEVEKAPASDKKSKRGKRAVNDEEQSNGVVEEAPALKKGKKKAAEDSNSNKDSTDELEAVAAEEIEQEDEVTEANGSSETAVTNTSRGRKKQTNKEEKEVKSKETKGKKGAKQDNTESETAEEKPKSKGRGRKAPQKAEVEQEDKSEDDDKPDPPTKGRKKAQPKAAPEDDESEKAPEDDEEIESVPKKKEPKGRKNVGKKAQAKEVEEKDDEVKDEPSAKKKDKKEKGDAKDEESEENTSESKPAKGKRGQKKNVEKSIETEEVQDTGEPVSKRRRKAEDKAPEPKKEIKSATNYDSLDFSNISKNRQGKDWNFKISNWNVDGIRAWLGKGGLDYIKHEKPDILCLQEIKCSKDKLPEEITNLPGYHAYWLCSDKDGYAGVGVFTTKLAMNVQYGLQNEELDSEGRIITAEYEQFYLICTYVPNSGRKLVTLSKRLKWNEEFRKYVKELDKTKPVIICGDMNVAHNEIDLTNPKTNKRNAGFTEEERSGMTELLGDGFVDTYRHFYPDKTGAYTFWSYMFNSRSKNVGWRLDYFIVSERLLPAICDSVIRDKVYGSDHCPISLFLHLSSADKPKE